MEPVYRDGAQGEKKKIDEERRGQNAHQKEKECVFKDEFSAELQSFKAEKREGFQPTRSKQRIQEHIGSKEGQ